MNSSRACARLVVAFATLSMLGAACGGDGTPEATTGGGGPAATGATATGPTGASGEDQGSNATTLNVGNFFFMPASLEVAGGTEIEVDNTSSSTPHTFTVKKTDIDLELSPSDSEDVTIDLDPGRYGFFCRIHPQMTGTLTVT